MLSIVVHAVLLVGAAAWVVQTVQAKRKLNFSAAPPAGVQGTKQLEYRVQTAKRTASMSAPPTSTRITTTAAQAKVALPEVALPPPASLAIPGRMSALAGSPAAFKPVGQTAASVMPAATISALPAGVGAFGFKLPPNAPVTGLRGFLLYMRRKPDKTPYPENPDRSDYLLRVERLFGDKGKLSEREAENYQRFSQPLITNVILFPSIPGETGPKAFGVNQEPGTQQSWCAVYKAHIYPEAPKRYRFVGGGNEVMIVRVDGKLVLDGSYAELPWSKGKNPTGFQPKGSLQALWSDGRRIGDWFQIGAGGADIEIVLGEGWGGAFGADLCVEEEGKTYSGEQRPLFKIEGYQKALPQIQQTLNLPEAVRAITLEGPTFRISK